MMYLNICQQGLRRQLGCVYVQCVNDTRNVTQDGQQDVDEEVCAATTLKEDSERGQENGDNDLDDVSEHLSAGALPA